MDGKDGLRAPPASVDGTVGGVSGVLEGLPVTWAACTGRPGTGLGGPGSRPRPMRLSQRSGRILAGQDAPRSRSHDAYVALEAVRAAALLATGSMLLTA
jgi:hypothetical protein